VQKGDLLFNWFNARQVLFHTDRAYLATDYHLLAVAQHKLPELTTGICRKFEETYKRLRVADYLDVRERHARLLRERGEDDPGVRQIEQGPLRWGRDKWDKWQQAKPGLFERFANECAWMTPLQATEALILAGEVIYAGSEDAVDAVDAANGRRLWSYPTGSRVRDLAVARGRLFVSTVDGRVRCFAASGTDREDHIIAGIPQSPAPVAAPPDMPWLDQLLAEAAAGQGYCLIVHASDSRLPVALARRTALRIEVVSAADADPEHLRREITAAGLYGGRICVRSVRSDTLPYPPYVFDLVIESTGGTAKRDMQTDGTTSSFSAEELFRVTKPCGGRLCLQRPEEGGAAVRSEEGNVESFRAQGASLTRIDERLVITRDPIPGAADWTHNYATAANTYCSEDPYVHGPFGVLWYGEPGPRERIDRHATPPMPLVSQGILFTIGYDRVMAYDVYNGRCHWKREIPGATRQHLPINTSNLAADRHSLFVVVEGGRCLRLDGKTGKTLCEYPLPAVDEADDADRAAWAWIAVDEDRLYGSRAETDTKRRWPREQTSHRVFALDKQTGEPVWTYAGTGIDHDGIAIAGGLLFLIDRRVTDAERDSAYTFPSGDESVPDRPAVDRRGQPIPRDVRKLVALDAASGHRRWARPLDLSDVTLDDRAVQGRGGVACMAKDGVIVVHGTGSLGHPHREFLDGQFDRRALYAFDCATGASLWGGRKGYRKRPIIVGGHVYAEPFAWDLRTGRTKQIANPLSGRPQPLDFHRGYIGCGHILASGKALFGARGGIGYCNLEDACGFRPFAGVDLACGLGAVPAGGVLAVPEGRAGCTCAVPIHTSLALYPRPDTVDWAVGFAAGRAPVVSLPVRHVAINLGAPGYRTDDSGNLWIPYPTRIDAGPLGDWLPTYQHDWQMCYQIPRPVADVSGTDMPWLYRFGYCHDKPLRFRILEDGAAPARYTVRLHFAEPEDAEVGQRVFSVRLQGQKVLDQFDVVREAGSTRRAVIQEFRGVQVDGHLEIQLQASDDSEFRQPVLCGFQAVREVDR
jgi:outer membrane protein assembly factor BamB